MKKKLMMIIGLGALVLVGAIATLVYVLTAPSKLDKYEYDLFVEGKALVEKDGSFGFINKKEEVVVPLQYDYIYF